MHLRDEDFWVLTQVLVVHNNCEELSILCQDHIDPHKYTPCQINNVGWLAHIEGRTGHGLSQLDFLYLWPECITFVIISATKYLAYRDIYLQITNNTHLITKVETLLATKPHLKQKIRQIQPQLLEMCKWIYGISYISYTVENDAKIWLIIAVMHTT